MSHRARRLNAIALALAISYAIAAVTYAERSELSPFVKFLLVYGTSIGFYELIVDLLFRLVEATPFLMKLYWGRMYVHGLWSYTYSLDGSQDGTVYFGVWRFEQTLYDTSIVGFGLTDAFAMRSHVRSVTDMVANGKVLEVVNIRSDSVDSSNEYYSRTTMFFELNRHRLIRFPIRMRGKTIFYGGPLSGRICINSFIKHEHARTEQDVIDELEANFRSSGSVHPPRKHAAPVAHGHP